MKITRITVYQVDLPYVGGTYHWAKGFSVSVADSTVVRLDTDEGVIGWGETCPLGATYLPAYAEGLRSGIGVLACHVIGLDPTRIGALNQVMDHEMLGHAYVKSALDIACHDILGKAVGLPVHALLGGRQSHAMPLYRAIPQDEPEVMLAAMAGFHAEGYHQFQLKVGGAPEQDIERIRCVVEAKRSGETVLADGNRGWRRDEAFRVAEATRGLDYTLEQPCARYEDCLAVRRRATQPFKLDEALQTMDDLLRAQRDDALDVACIKVSKQGGLTKARLIRDVCAATDIAMTVEDTWGGEIVSAALAHLAASTPPQVLLNTTDLHNYNTVHIAEGVPVAQDGHLVVSDAPGLGITPIEDVLGDPVAVYE